LTGKPREKRGHVTIPPFPLSLPASTNSHLVPFLSPPVSHHYPPSLVPIPSYTSIPRTSRCTRWMILARLSSIDPRATRTMMSTFRYQIPGENLLNLRDQQTPRCTRLLGRDVTSTVMAFMRLHNICWVRPIGPTWAQPNTAKLVWFVKV